jgi:hypothetical protein
VSSSTQASRALAYAHPRTEPRAALPWLRSAAYTISMAAEARPLSSRERYPGFTPGRLPCLPAPPRARDPRVSAPRWRGLSILPQARRTPGRMRGSRPRVPCAHTRALAAPDTRGWPTEGPRSPRLTALASGGCGGKERRRGGRLDSWDDEPLFARPARLEVRCSTAGWRRPGRREPRRAERSCGLRSYRRQS